MYRITIGERIYFWVVYNLELLELRALAAVCFPPGSSVLSPAGENLLRTNAMLWNDALRKTYRVACAYSTLSGTELTRNDQDALRVQRYNAVHRSTSERLKAALFRPQRAVQDRSESERERRVWFSPRTSRTRC